MANVVDVPPSFREPSHFTPRAGRSDHWIFYFSKIELLVSDMFGFKVEGLAHEKSTNLKSRPIYLDMQV